MADIVHDFPVRAPPGAVFAAISTPTGLDAWWTKTCTGMAEQGAEFELGFGPGYDWKGVVTHCIAGESFELDLTHADPDWTGTRVGFRLESAGEGTHVRFQHLGWLEANDHYRTSCFCWAMYLRLLKRFAETGKAVPYEKRLDA